MDKNIDIAVIKYLDLIKKSILKLRVPIYLGPMQKENQLTIVILI
jgi:hypothetical protein